jgi:hypothetical protein
MNIKWPESNKEIVWLSRWKRAIIEGIHTIISRWRGQETLLL